MLLAATDHIARAPANRRSSSVNEESGGHLNGDMSGLGMPHQQCSGLPDGAECRSVLLIVLKVGSKVFWSDADQLRGFHDPTRGTRATSATVLRCAPSLPGTRPHRLDRV